MAWRLLREVSLSSLQEAKAGPPSAGPSVTVLLNGDEELNGIGHNELPISLFKCYFHGDLDCSSISQKSSFELFASYE